MRLKPTTSAAIATGDRRHDDEQAAGAGCPGASSESISDPVHGRDLGRASSSRSLRRRRATYASSVLSRTIAPCGHPARTRSRRRTASPGFASSRASSRNSVGVSATEPSRRRRRARPGRAGAPRRRWRRHSRCAAAAPAGVPRARRMRTVCRGSRRRRHRSRRSDRPGVVGGEKQHGRVDALRAKRLAQVAAVAVREADVDHERIRHPTLEAVEQLAAGRNRLGREAFLPQPARENAAQLVVVLDDHDPLAERHRTRNCHLSGTVARGRSGAGQDCLQLHRYRGRRDRGTRPHEGLRRRSARSTVSASRSSPGSSPGSSARTDQGSRPRCA